MIVDFLIDALLLSFALIDDFLLFFTSFWLNASDMVKKPEDLTPACYVLLKHALPSYNEFYEAAVLNASSLASRSMFAVLK